MYPKDCHWYIYVYFDGDLAHKTLAVASVMNTLAFIRFSSNPKIGRINPLGSTLLICGHTMCENFKVSIFTYSLGDLNRLLLSIEFLRVFAFILYQLFVH